VDDVVEQWSDGPDGEADDLTSAELDVDGTQLDSIETELADVERALALLDEGTYGQCEHCGAVIDDDVLARTPTARFCAQHLPFALR
jgi:RNA polymerase-binding transcription factor DksA